MIIIRNKVFPFGRYQTMNLFGMLITKDKNLTDIEINHEKIHTAQFLEMACVGLLIMFILCVFVDISIFWVLLGIPFFYIWYGIEFLITRCFNKTQHSAYRDISFEEEAYTNQSNLNYLRDRKYFGWMKYLNPKSEERE